MASKHFPILLLTLIGTVALSKPELAAQPQTTLQTSTTAALHAKDAYPEGEFEVDYNLADPEGFRHGLWIRVYEDGALYYRGDFEHGVPVGKWWFFRSDGSAISHMSHHPDSSRTEAIMFNVQGQMIAMGGYVKPSIRLKAEMLTERPSAPIKEGKWSFFNNKGQLTSVVHYKAGVKHGAEETFSSSGGLLSTGMYVDGLKNGAWKRFTSSGILEELLTFKDGDLHGPAKASTGRGKPVSEGAYHNGEQDGTWMFYLDDGRVHEISVFEEGDLVNNVRVNGPFTDWHNQDRPASEVHYRNKLKDGPFTEWHNQGGFVIEEQVDPDMGGTVQRKVMKGLQISREGEYVQDQLDGAVYHYDTSGRLTRTEHYNMGVLVKTDVH